MIAHVGIAVTPGGYEPNGFTRRVALNYGAAFERLGLAPIYVDLGTANADDLRRLLLPDVKLLFSHNGWLFSERTSLGPGGVEALRQANTPAIVLIADPVFSWWLPGIFAALPPRAMPFFIDPFFAEGIAHWIPAGTHAAYLPCIDTTGPHLDIATRDKSRRAVFFGNTGSPKEILDELSSDRTFKSITVPILQKTLYNPSMPLITAATNVFASLGAAINLDDPYVRRLLIYIDRFLRAYQRVEFVKRILDHDVDIFGHGLAELARGRRARAHPPVDFSAMTEILGQSRTLYVCQPHFPGALNERIVFAMRARCLVIATPNLRTPQVFDHGRHLYLTAPDWADLDLLAETAQDDAVVEPIRDAAAARVNERHTPEANIRHMLRRMREAGLIDDEITVPEGPELSVPAL